MIARSTESCLLICLSLLIPYINAQNNALQRDNKTSILLLSVDVGYKNCHTDVINTALTKVTEKLNSIALFPGFTFNISVLKMTSDHGPQKVYTITQENFES